MWVVTKRKKNSMGNKSAIYSLRKYFRSAYYVLGTVCAAEMKEKDKNPSKGELNNKYVICQWKELKMEEVRFLNVKI